MKAIKNTCAFEKENLNVDPKPTHAVNITISFLAHNVLMVHSLHHSFPRTQVHIFLISFKTS